jgi:hypothetical protein
MTTLKELIESNPALSKKLKRTGRQLEYFETIDKVIVTYHDGGTKEFDSDNWSIFEDKVRPIAKKIRIIRRPNWFQKILRSPFGILQIVSIVVFLLILLGFWIYNK